MYDRGVVYLLSLFDLNWNYVDWMQDEKMECSKSVTEKTFGETGVKIMTFVDKKC